jgi:cell fate regulator YaaT (PSP1 superfamily)
MTEREQTAGACPGRLSELVEVAFRARRLGIFSNTTGAPVDMGARVVVSVDRGEDMGRVTGKLAPGTVPETAGEILREALPSDLERAESNRAYEERVLEFCRDRVRARKLDMKLTGCESQLDRRKIRIFFTAEQRTDFRALVRDLAAEFRTRIEMRQVGVRDEARHRDGVGICGQRLCCSAFLRDFTSVTLKSVREQNLAPNPSKVSGTCSRLMCCLAYEIEFYRRAARLYPEPGSRLRLEDGNATVQSVDIFGETVTLIMEKGAAVTMDLADLARKRRMGRRHEGDPAAPEGGDLSEETDGSTEWQDT